METYGLEKLGIINAGAVYRNLTPAQLLRHRRDQILRNGVIVDVVHQNTQF